MNAKENEVKKEREGFFNYFDINENAHGQTIGSLKELMKSVEILCNLFFFQ